MNRYLAALYSAAPIWAQNAMLTGFSAMLERERYGGRYAEFCQLLARTEWLSHAELQAYQDERLRTVVAHAYDAVPYYRRIFDERKLKPSDIRGQHDLPKIPLLTRNHIKRHFEELRSRGVSAKALRTGHTSGTTGTPLTVGYDHETVWMTYAVFDRHYRWAGCRLGKDGNRVAVARGNVIVPLSQRRPPFWRVNRQQRQLLLSAFHMSKTNLAAYFDAVVAQYVITTVPDPEAALDEIARVTKAGGEIILVNHLGAEMGFRRAFERSFAPVARRLGWRPEFRWGRLAQWAAGHAGVRVVERRPMPPLGHFSLIRFGKTAIKAPMAASAGG
jgi:SAM-dependent methyltransferase